MSIELLPISNSSQIKGIGYDADSKTLAIQFNKGAAAYHYTDVPQEAYDALLAAESKGSHFGQHIRGKYQHTLQAAEGEQDGKAA